MGFSEHLSRSFPGRSPVIDYWQNSKRFIIFTACSLMSFEPGDVFLSPEHPGPNCSHPLAVASLFVLVISQILIAERRSLSVF